MKTLFLLLSLSLHAFSIVFIHVGPSPLPEHLSYSVAQARLFNPHCPIYLIAHEAALQSNPFASLNIIHVPCESLPLSPAHQEFQNCANHLQGGAGFWIWTSERFFYLDSLIRAHQLTDIFHLENDVMLYADLEAMLPTFQTHYPNMIAATFEKDDRCVPGFLYIANSQPMELLANFFPRRIEEGQTDMDTLAKFKNKYQGIHIDFLPITLPEYIQNQTRPFFFKKASNPKQYTRHFEHFQSLFDAAAIGVYLAGWDPRFHDYHEPGQVNANCMFDASHFTYEWELDSQGRKIPILNYKGKRVRINNLHITNKGKISLFSSLRSNS
ncbi:MAG TPA: hypothetical protein VLE89_04275 [Chlamydiales bacterium]|nr:hypothetical protein [Chlamydiales bacterium]